MAVAEKRQSFWCDVKKVNSFINGQFKKRIFNINDKFLNLSAVI